MREANNELAVKLFVCECWGESGGRVTCSIPFCESVEIGQSACSRNQEKSSSGGARPTELQFANGSDLVFTFVRMGLTGDTTMDAISTPPKTVKVLTPEPFLLLPRTVNIRDRLYCVHHVHLHGYSLVSGLATFVVAPDSCVFCCRTR